MKRLTKRDSSTTLLWLAGSLVAFNLFALPAVSLAADAGWAKTTLDIYIDTSSIGKNTYNTNGNGLATAILLRDCTKGQTVSVGTPKVACANLGVNNSSDPNTGNIQYKLNLGEVPGSHYYTWNGTLSAKSADGLTVPSGTKWKTDGWYLDIRDTSDQTVAFAPIEPGMIPITNNGKTFITVKGPVTSNGAATTVYTKPGDLPAGTGLTDTVFRLFTTANACPASEALTCWIAAVFSFAQTAILLLATAVITGAGVLYMSSAGNTKQIELSKKLITGALTGVAVVVLGHFFLQYVIGVSWL